MAEPYSAPNTIRDIDELSRRAALSLAAAGAGAGLATLVVACDDGGGGDQADTTQTVSPERKRGEAAALQSLLDLERTAVYAYAATRKLLGPLAERFLAH